MLGGSYGSVYYGLPYATPIPNITVVTLTIDSAQQSIVSDNPVLAQASILSIDSALQAQTVAVPSLTQNNVLSILSASQATSSDNPALIPNFTLTPHDAVHSQSSDTVVLQQHNILQIFSAGQGQTVDPVSMTLSYILSIDDAYHHQSVTEGQILRHVKARASGRILDNVLPAGNTRDTVIVARMGRSAAAGNTFRPAAPSVSLRRPMASITKIIP